MDDSRLDEKVDIITVQVVFPSRQVIRQLYRVWGDEGCVFDRASGPANPVLVLAKFARRFVLAANTVHQNAMQFTDKAQTDRVRLQMLTGGKKGGAVIGYLLNILVLLALLDQTGF